MHVSVDCDQNEQIFYIEYFIKGRYSRALIHNCYEIGRWNKKQTFNPIYCFIHFYFYMIPTVYYSKAKICSNKNWIMFNRYNIILYKLNTKN